MAQGEGDAWPKSRRPGGRRGGRLAEEEEGYERKELPGPGDEELATFLRLPPPPRRLRLPPLILRCSRPQRSNRKIGPAVFPVPVPVFSVRLLFGRYLPRSARLLLRPQEILLQLATEASK
jgi:hypothetical protein